MFNKNQCNALSFLGCFFAFGRSILLPDLKPGCCHRHLWSIIKVVLATLCGLIAYATLGPAILWSTVYKVATTAEEILDS